MSRAVVVLIMLGALFMGGCPQSAQQAGGQLSGLSKNGSQLTTSSRVPDELKDFPVPQGFKELSGTTLTQGSEKSYMGTWQGRSAYQPVADFYQKEMPDQGWETDTSMDSADGGVQIYTKADAKLTITFVRQGDDIQIGALLTK